MALLTRIRIGAMMGIVWKEVMRMAYSRRSMSYRPTCRQYPRIEVMAG